MNYTAPTQFDQPAGVVECPRVEVTTPCRMHSQADRLALVTASNSGFPGPERDDATQPGPAESSSQVSAPPPETSPGGQPNVTVSKQTLGASFDRIPVHKISPVI